MLAYWRNFMARNGTALGLFLMLAVGFWIFVMILLPQAFMLDFSFRFNLPPAEVGTEKDVYTTTHYEYLAFGSESNKESYNVIDVQVFFRTILAAVFVATKIVHELSHAVMCRRLGSRCGDVGILLLVGIPCPYCDVTEIWRQPSASRTSSNSKRTSRIHSSTERVGSKSKWIRRMTPSRSRIRLVGIAKRPSF